MGRSLLPDEVSQGEPPRAGAACSHTDRGTAKRGGAKSWTVSGASAPPSTLAWARPKRQNANARSQESDARSIPSWLTSTPHCHLLASWSLLLVSGCFFLLEFTAVRRPCREAGSSGQAKRNNRTHFSAAHTKNEGSEPTVVMSIGINGLSVVSCG